MDFNFSDDQQQLRDAVAKWVEKGGGFSREAWDELAELGLGGLYIPEEEGGLGMGAVEGMVVMEELGRGIVLEPLAQAFIAGAALAGGGWTVSGTKSVVPAGDEADAFLVPAQAGGKIALFLVERAASGVETK